MKSPAIACALMVVCTALIVNSSSSESNISSMTDQILMEYMMKPRQADDVALTPTTESNFIPCFNYYFPLLINYTETYHKNNEACIKTFNTQKAALDAEGEQVRTNITAISIQVSILINSCLANNDTLDFFDCFSISGDHTVRQVYSISENASEGAANYRETLRVITTTAEICSRETGRAYTVNTSEVHEDLDHCLVNGLNATIPATNASTSAPTAAPTTAPTPVPTTTV